MALDSVVFRCDANVAAGTGHVMRCVALAQAWQDAGGQAVFAMAETTAALGTRLADESCEVFSVSGAAGTESDSRQTIALARDRGAEWIVVDGYQFTAEYQHALKAAGLKVLFVDDYGHAAHYSADVVLNQNAYANEGLYQRRGPLTRLLLGPRYCLLRREFSAWRSWKRNVLPVCRRALAIMGGSDPENLTARAIEALAGFEDIDATIVVGGSNPNFTTLQNAAARSGRKMTARRDVSNMAEIFAETDVAIS